MGATCESTVRVYISMGLDFKANRNSNAKKVNHECLREDRPSHGRDVRASKDGLVACRRVNVMASLYAEISVTGFKHSAIGFFRQVQCKFSSSLLSKNELGCLWRN
jgi:hypothetical protein